MPFLKLRNFPCISSFLRVLIWNVCWNLSSAFFCIYCGVNIIFLYFAYLFLICFFVIMKLIGKFLLLNQLCTLGQNVLSFYIVSDLICSNFDKKNFIYDHEGYWSAIVLLVMSSSVLKSGHSGEYFLLFNCVEVFV